MQSDVYQESPTIALGKVTTLDHKVLDHTVEGRSFITESLLAGSQGPKMSDRDFPSRIWSCIPEVLSSLYPS